MSERPFRILNGILPRTEWRIDSCGEQHVLILCRVKDGYADYAKVELLDLPVFLNRLKAEEEAVFGPWPARLTRIKDQPLHSENAGAPAHG